MEVVPCGITARAELGDRHHAALDVHVAVAEAGDEIAAGGVDHLVVGADGVAGVRPQ